jgi:hypothetical protein
MRTIDVAGLGDGCSSESCTTSTTVTVGVARLGDDSDASGAPCVHTCESERDCAAADSVEPSP